MTKGFVRGLLAKGDEEKDSRVIPIEVDKLKPYEGYTFPPLSYGEREALKKSIAEEGIHDALQVVPDDGRQVRQRAARVEHGQCDGGPSGALAQPHQTQTHPHHRAAEQIETERLGLDPQNQDPRHRGQSHQNKRRADESTGPQTESRDATSAHIRSNDHPAPSFHQTTS